RRITVNRQRPLLFLNRHAQPELVVEVLGYAEAKLASPAKSRSVLSINDLGQGFGSVVHALGRLCYKAPHLTTGKRQATIESCLSQELAWAERVAVALIVVGGRSGRQEISLVVTADLDLGQLAFH